MTGQNLAAAIADTAGGLPAPDVGGRRLAGRLRQAFRSGWLVAGTSVVGFFVLLAIIGPFFAPSPYQLSTATYQAPSVAHWLGTTQTGQDVFAQLVVSARASLEIGAGAGLLATAISILVGITGGYVGGFIDEALSLLSNVILVIPTFPLIIVTFAYVKQGNLTALILVIALTSWAAAARVLRAQTLSVRNREYVLAARASGERAWRIILVEILPNELPIIVSQFIFAMIFAILTQATIAFLGVVDVSQLTWGNMLYFAWNDEALQSGAWWWFIPPGACIALLGMGLALINFSMDELLNPQLRTYRPAKEQRRGKPRREAIS
jgi:peptide/nickel transport system permease protein